MPPSLVKTYKHISIGHSKRGREQSISDRARIPTYSTFPTIEQGRVLKQGYSMCGGVQSGRTAGKKCRSRPMNSQQGGRVLVPGCCLVNWTSLKADTSDYTAGRIDGS